MDFLAHTTWPPMIDQNPFAGYQLPPLPWLRAFEASARHSSFTLAAAELNLTQAAISHQVRSLEKHLGVTLFERLPRSLRLTEIGAAYLPPLRRSFDDLAAATAGLFGPVGKRSLTIRAPISFVALWLAPRLEGFTRHWPQISLRIQSVVWAHSQGDEPADIDIRFGDGVWPGFKSEILFRSPVLPVCSRDLVEQGDDAERMTKYLAHKPLIHVTGYEDLWQRLMRPLGFNLPSYAGLNVDTSISALELAASGLGPAMVLEAFVEPYLKNGRLVTALETALPVEQAHYLLHADSQKRSSPEAMLFRKWILEESGITGREAI